MASSQEILKNFFASGPVQKTGVMWLTEICVKEGCPPKFTERDLKEKAQDAPNFEIHCRVPRFQGRSYEAAARAPNKKTAKQAAALEVLVLMGIKPSDLMEMKSNNMPFGAMEASRAPDNPNVAPDIVAEVTSKLAKVTLPDDNTYVTQLLELCEQRMLPSPEFRDVKNEGPPHNKTFWVEGIIKLPTKEVKVVGVANQKKKAKQQAAGLLREELKSMTPEETRVSAPPPSLVGVGRQHMTCKDKINCSQLIGHLHHRFLDMVVTEHVPRGTAFETVGDAEKALLKISKENNKCFSHEFLDLPPTDTPFFHSICTLKYLSSSKQKGPDNMFLAGGKSFDEARKSSTVKAIEYLQEVSNN